MAHLHRLKLCRCPPTVLTHEFDRRIDAVKHAHLPSSQLAVLDRPDDLQGNLMPLRHIVRQLLHSGDNTHPDIAQNLERVHHNIGRHAQDIREALASPLPDEQLAGIRNELPDLKTLQDRLQEYDVLGEFFEQRRSDRMGDDKSQDKHHADKDADHVLREAIEAAKNLAERVSNVMQQLLFGRDSLSGPSGSMQ